MNTESRACGANEVIASALELAREATHRLTDAGIHIYCAWANGRRPVLYVDRIPEGVESSVKRQHPNGAGGVTVVRAAPYYGCQLETMQDVPSDRVVPIEAPLKRHLEVVRG